MARVAWIAGGVVAVSNPGADVQIGAGLGGRLLCTIAIPTYEAFFPVLHEHGFMVVGAIFIEDSKEARGLDRPQFRAMSTNGRWLVTEVHQRWRQIAHASGQRDDMRLMDVAARIASGLAYSELRLQDLSEAYGKQLRGRVESGPVDGYYQFKDTNSITVYKAIHALFWEMAVLRDVLAEFAATYCLARPKKKTLSGLIDSLKKEPSIDHLAARLMDYTDENSDGWLAKFTAYRNLFTHSAPMDQIAGTAFAVQDSKTLSPTLSVPQIYYPLPAKVFELRERRSGVSLPFAKLQDLIDSSCGRKPQRNSEPDALDYLSGCLAKMAELADTLSLRSPIEARPIEIHIDDLIGGLQVTKQ